MPRKKTRDNCIMEGFHPDSTIIGAVLDYNKDDKCADQVLCMDIIMGERCWRWRPNKRLTHSHLSCSGHGSATGGVKTQLSHAALDQDQVNLVKVNFMIFCEKQDNYGPTMHNSRDEATNDLST